jgi:hypothetical protein
VDSAIIDPFWALRPGNTSAAPRSIPRRKIRTFIINLLNYFPVFTSNPLSWDSQTAEFAINPKKIDKNLEFKNNLKKFTFFVNICPALVSGALGGRRLMDFADGVEALGAGYSLQIFERP